MEVRIPALSGKYVSKLGANEGEWQLIGHVTSSSTTFDTLGLPSEACAIKLLQAGFRRVYAIYLGQNQP